MLIENIQHNPASSKQKITPLSPATKLPSKGYFKLDLHQAWINFIRTYEPFQWYVTLTFKEPRHPEACNKAFYRWIRHINQCLYGRRYREKQKGVTWIKAIEYQKREVIHFHCLIGSPELYKLKRLEFMKVWETDCGRRPSRFKADPNRFDRVQADPPEAPEAMSQAERDCLNDLCPDQNEREIDCINTDKIINGIARIYKYDHSRGAINYCSKYVLKGGEVDLFISPDQWRLLSNTAPMLGIQFAS